MLLLLLIIVLFKRWMLSFQENYVFKSQSFVALYLLFTSSPLPWLRDNWKHFSHFFNVALLGLFNKCLLQTGKIVLLVLGSWSVSLHSPVSLFLFLFFLWICIWCQINRRFKKILNKSDRFVWCVLLLCIFKTWSILLKLIKIWS